MSKEKSQFIKSTLIIAVCAFSSRILGLLRQILLGYFFGATESKGLADCYSAAFKLPDIIFNLVAFGAISIVLIPYFSRFVKKEEFDKLKKACSSFLNFFFIMISFFIIIGFFITPYAVKNFLVKGWTNQANINLTILMTRILLLQVLFMTLSGIFGSYLNAIEKFTAYSLALLSYNVGIIFGILFLRPYFGIIGVAIGAVLGSFLHFSLQAAGAIINGYRYSFHFPKFNKDIKELILIAIPRVTAISGEQFVKFFLVSIASFIFTGSIYVFEVAENFSMVAYGTVAVSISTTSFPIFSKLFVSGEYDKMLDTLLEKFSNVIFFIFPVSAFMIIFRYEIIEVLLGYGKFSGRDVIIAGDALAFYMIGIPFFSITIILAKFYYAAKRSIVPMISTLTAAVLTVAGCYIFAKNFDVSGLSMGRSLGYIVQVLILIISLLIINSRIKIFKLNSYNYKCLFNIFKITIISFILTAIGFLMNRYLSFIFTPGANFFSSLITIKVLNKLISPGKIIALFRLVAFGGVLCIVYISICYIVKVPEINEFIKRKITKRTG